MSREPCGPRCAAPQGRRHQRWFVMLACGAALAAGPLVRESLAAGDSLFAGDQVHAISIAFAQPAWRETLAAWHDAGVETYLPAVVVVNGASYDSVGVRFKGQSSYLFSNDKKPFRLVFDEFRGSQRLDGLKSVHLNNAWRDPSFLREKLHLGFLRDAGVAAPRANHATLEVNGEPWGLYVLVEHVDKKFLESRFGEKDGNLYKAVDGIATNAGGGPPPLSDFRWYGPDPADYTDRYELKTDDSERPWSDLLAVADALAHSPDLPAALPSLVQLERFGRAMAADNLLGNLDSYAGSGRNFYAYFPKDGRPMEWIAWDAGLSFGAYRVDRTDPRTLPPDYVSDDDDRPLLARLLGEPALRRDYLDGYAALFRDQFSVPRLLARVDSLAALVRPYVLADPKKATTNEQFEESLVSDVRLGDLVVPGLASFLRARAATVAAWLAADGGAPAGCRLAGIVPNPARSSVSFTVELASAGSLRLEVFDPAGRRVAELANGAWSAGSHTLDADVSGLAPGLYLCRLRAARGESVKRIVVLP
ncbi:MAG: CotH kinase family protein [Candidatus Eisenbacteria bacterium]|nr:CotH kinase family protein [Candidatus Eisenbacteria bacterium]